VPAQGSKSASLHDPPPPLASVDTPTAALRVSTSSLLVTCRLVYGHPKPWLRLRWSICALKGPRPFLRLRPDVDEVRQRHMQSSEEYRCRSGSWRWYKSSLQDGRSAICTTVCAGCARATRSVSARCASALSVRRSGGGYASRVLHHELIVLELRRRSRLERRRHWSALALKALHNDRMSGSCSASNSWKAPGATLTG
jgi:hypothetical protein